MGRDRTVGYIENGTVIDHIPSGEVFKVAQLLDIQDFREGRGSLGWGLESDKLGRKGVLKIQDVYLNPEQTNLVALVAPYASISVIRDGEVEGKRKAEIPEKLEGLIDCGNPRCVTNNPKEKEPSVVRYDSRSEEFTCEYCGFVFGRQEAVSRLYD